MKKATKLHPCQDTVLLSSLLTIGDNNYFPARIAGPQTMAFKREVEK